jgi:hypothetical protein
MAGRNPDEAHRVATPLEQSRRTRTPVLVLREWRKPATAISMTSDRTD